MDINTIMKLVRQLVRTSRTLVRTAIAPYCVMDNYGTYQYCWTLDAAMAWIKYCGPIVTVMNCYTGNVVASRVQG